MKKYNFIEFLAAYESKNFFEIEESAMTWAKHFLKSYDNVWDQIHAGDCTKQSHSCGLCLLELFLSDYKAYTFNEQVWLKDNGL